MVEKVEVDASVTEHIGLADLDEAPVGCEHGKRSRHGGPGQRIEDDIHPCPVRPVHDLSGEVRRAGIHHVRYAHLPQAGALFIGPGRRKHLGLRLPG